jgi:hypothetical protein
MSLISILEAAEGGRFFANAAKASGLDEAQARHISEKFSIAIAQRLKDKAAADPEAFEKLLDLIEEGDVSDLQENGALTDQDAQADGAEILADIYGSAAAANAVFKGLAGPVDKSAASTLAVINATAVLAALSATNAATLSGGAAKAADTGGGGGFLSIIFAALLKGLMQGAARQLAPKRRRRRYSYSTRRRTTRRRTRSPGLEDIFKDILTGRR